MRASLVVLMRHKWSHWNIVLPTLRPLMEAPSDPPLTSPTSLFSARNQIIFLFFMIYFNFFLNVNNINK